MPRSADSLSAETQAALAGAASWGWLWRALALLAGLAAVGVALRVMPALDAGLLERRVVGQDAAGMAVFVALAALGCAVGVPRQAAAFAAGTAFAPAFGPWSATALATGLALAAQLLGCAADYIWARLIAGDWVGRRLPPRLARIEARLVGRPFTATLTLRLLPVGNNLALSLLGGACAVPAGPFLAASALGYLPQTLVCVLLGSGTRLGRGTEIAVAALLFAASAALGAWLLRAPAAQPADGRVKAISR